MLKVKKVGIWNAGATYQQLQGRHFALIIPASLNIKCLVILPFHLHQLFVIAAFRNPSTFHSINPVCITDRGKPMRDNDHGLVLEKFINMPKDFRFRNRIN